MEVSRSLFIILRSITTVVGIMNSGHSYEWGIYTQFIIIGLHIYTKCSVAGVMQDNDMEGECDRSDKVFTRLNNCDFSSVFYSWISGNFHQHHNFSWHTPKPQYILHVIRIFSSPIYNATQSMDSKITEVVAILSSMLKERTYNKTTKGNL